MTAGPNEKKEIVPADNFAVWQIISIPGKQTKNPTQDQQIK